MLEEVAKGNFQAPNDAARLQQDFQISERRACRLVGQPRGTQRYIPSQAVDEDALTQAIVALAAEYGRYGYRRITALLDETGWSVGQDRVQRIWRREGLKVPKKQKPRGTTVAQRWFLCLAASHPCTPCLVV
jgi:transposase InsO family protein